MMKKYMMRVAALLMVAGNLFAVEEVNVLVDHQHTHGVQEHKHEVVVKRGPTFDEMVKSAESTIWPGAWTGIIDGAAQGGIAIRKNKINGEGKKLKAYSISGFDLKINRIEAEAATVDALAAIAEDVWRNNPNQFSQREEGKASGYLVEKIVHNMFKFAVGLATIEAYGKFKDKKSNADVGYKIDGDYFLSGNMSPDIQAQKALFIEGYLNTLCRDRKVLDGTISKGIANILLRGITEGVQVSAKNDSVAWTITFNPERAAAVMVAIIVGEGTAKVLSRNSKSRSAKRFERILTNALTALAKTSMYGRNSNNTESANMVSAIQQMTGIHGLAIVTGLTGLAWLSQHRYTRNVIGFLADVTALVAHAKASR